MVTVALVGVGSGFGLTVLKTFLRLNEGAQPRHKIVVLSRSPQPIFPARGIDLRVTDYTDHTQLVMMLRDVHTVLSFIGGGSPEALMSAQVAVLNAAKEAGVRRFAPSDYAGVGYEGIDLYEPKARVWKAVQQSGLEYARFDCGLFMSVLATGTPKPVTEVGIREGCKTGEEEALAGLRPWNFVVNIQAGTADLAGDGSAEMVLTEMRDIARFLFEALSLKKWQPIMGMRGDVVTFKEIVHKLEQVSGRKFLIKENAIEALQQEAKAHQSKAFYNQARVAIAQGWALVSDELNHAFPDMETVKVDDFIEKWWADVKLAEPAWVENKAFGDGDMDKQ